MFGELTKDRMVQACGDTYKWHCAVWGRDVLLMVTFIVYFELTIIRLLRKARLLDEALLYAECTVGKKMVWVIAGTKMIFYFGAGR